MRFPRSDWTVDMSVGDIVLLVNWYERAQPSVDCSSPWASNHELCQNLPKHKLVSQPASCTLCGFSGTSLAKIIPCGIASQPVSRFLFQFSP